MGIAAGLSFISVICASVIGYPALSYISAQSTFITLMSWGSALIVFILPIILILSLLIRLYGPYRLKKKWRKVLTWIWSIAFIILCATSMFVIKDFSYYTEVEENKYFSADSDVITLSLGPDRNERDGSIFNINSDDFYIDEDGLNCGNIRVKVHNTSEDQIRIEQKVRSNGSSRKNAKYNAANVFYEVDVNDGVLTFPRTYLLPKGNKFRGQRIELDVYIPKGKTLDVDRKLRYFNFRNRYDKE